MLVAATHSLLPLSPSASAITELQSLLRATDDTLLTPAVSAALLSQLNTRVAAFQLLGLSFTAMVQDVSHVPVRNKTRQKKKNKFGAVFYD